MHIVTFYSYKGGVGRTMALVNAAAVLAERGRKVLIVDFDLEAPGISTYKPFSCLTNAKGVVEYVTEYVETAIAPKVEDFIVEARLGSANIWAMPAGKRNREYSSRLNSIDWQSLYAVQSGYLFFEDVKQQWKALGFDYVLIDSRTGHTDVGGICTRQLPDAVVLMFFPNDQNLIGLESVVKDIREEPKGLRRKDILLHFCASNVPDLDDEDHILERKLADARKILNYRSSPALIHHYNSLTLLEQSLFILDRPESKLAAEYKSLVDLIVSQNLEDPKGAISELQRLRDVLRQRSRDDDGEESLIGKRLEEIRDLHPTNGEIGWLMAHVFSLMGDLANETRSLTIAVEAGFHVTTARRRRAAIARLQGRSDDALVDLQSILSNPQTAAVEFVAAVELLRDFDPSWISIVANSPLLKKLDAGQSVRLADILMSDLKGNELVVAMMRGLIRTLRPDDSIYYAAESRLILALISSNQFQQAMEETGDRRENILNSENVVRVFNYAMAEWGHTNSVPLDLMARVLELGKSDQGRSSNRHQCFALAHHLCGEGPAARVELERARMATLRLDGREFSCWRYLEVTRTEMRNDLEALEKFVSGDGPGPAVFSRDPENLGGIFFLD